MLTGKQKRFLRAMGSTVDPIFQIGKGGLNENMIKQLDDVLEARELIKVKVLNNCLADIDDLAEQIAKDTGAVVAQTIGHIILLYRKSQKKPVIVLPKNLS
jgi:RNA-binding protein